MATTEHLPGSTAQHEPTGVPTGRMGMWWFMASEVVVFGGLSGSYLGDTWELQGTGWQERTAVTSPGARAWAAASSPE